jgi:RNA polymerase sigma-70 factor (ECF subfamily)
MEKQSDEKLMARFQQGDMLAFEALLERHRRPVYRFIRRQVGHPNTAEDLLQDVFLRLVHRAQSFESRSKFTTWLYTIARNLCIDHLRKQVHRRAASLDQPLGAGEDQDVTLLSKLAGDEPAPDREAHNRRLRDCLQRAVEELSQEQREVFVMREDAGLPFEEIARIVEAPVNTVKSRMRYALQNLRTRLEAEGFEP